LYAYRKPREASSIPLEEDIFIASAAGKSAMLSARRASMTMLAGNQLDKFYG